MTNDCLTCISESYDNTTIDTENTIPQWYKEEGNYSLLPKIISCDDKYNAFKNDIKNWVEEEPKITGRKLKIKFNTGKKNTWIFYWASDSYENITKIKGPKEAYGDLKNKGLKKTDRNGNCYLILNCPQPYQVNNVTYPGHIHFIHMNEDNTWNTDVRTIKSNCMVTKNQLKEVIKSNDHIIINALRKEDYNQSIPTSISIPYDSFYEDDKKTKKKLILYIKKNQQKKDKLKKMEIFNLPIIIYCASPKCNASRKLKEKMRNVGFVNISEFPGGLKDWFSEEKDGDSNEKSKKEYTPINDYVPTGNFVYNEDMIKRIEKRFNT